MKERDFSMMIRKSLERDGYRAIPVETGGTVAGFPDLFIVGGGIATFIEVKSRPALTVRQVSRLKSLLGPGQREFMREFNKGTMGAGTVGRFCLVACACSDGTVIMAVDSHGDMKVVSSWELKEGAANRRLLSEAIYSGYMEGGKER